MIGFLIALLSLSCLGLAVLLWLLNSRLAKVESILRAREAFGAYAADEEPREVAADTSPYALNTDAIALLEEIASDVTDDIERRAAESPSGQTKSGMPCITVGDVKRARDEVLGGKQPA